MSCIVGKKGDLGPVVEVELGEDPRYVLLHGRHAHEQLATDLRVRSALANGHGNLAFLLAEPGQQRAGVLTAPVRIGVSDVGYELAVIDGERIGSPAATRVTARRISAGGVSFSRKPTGPGPEGTQHVLIGVEHGHSERYRPEATHRWNP